MPHRHLPHLAAFENQPIVFLTTVTHNRRPILACDAVHDMLCQVWRQALPVAGWQVGRYVVMPDHVHLFVRNAHDARSLSAWMEAWKSTAARRLARELGFQPPIWQRDYFDRYLRSSDDYTEKWDYVVANPVRKGLVSEAQAWRWQGEIGVLEH